MTTFVTDALAGFLQSGGQSARQVETEKSAHQIFLSTELLPITNKLQKEVRGRRFRDVQSQMKSVLVALKKFETEVWPPHEGGLNSKSATNNTLNIPTNIFESKQLPLSSLVADDSSVMTENDDDDATVTTVESSAVGTVVGGDDNADGERADKAWDSVVGDAALQQDAVLKLNTPPPLEDDPNTREPVHGAVVEALDLYIVILKHPSKTAKACELCLESIDLLVNKHYLSGRAGGRDDSSGSGSQVLALAEKEGGELPPPSLLYRVMESVTRCSNFSSDAVQLAVVKVLRSMITSPKCGVHEGSLLLALRSSFHVYLVAKGQATKDSAKSALVDMLRSVFGRLEAHDAMLRSATASLANAQENAMDQNENWGDAHSDEDTSEDFATQLKHHQQQVTKQHLPPPPTPFPSQYHTDGYVMFRALCKLSSKELPGDTEQESNRSSLFSSPVDPMALNNKVLSLELILAVMDYSGNAFCQGEKFIYLVQNYLCVGLLKNCMSNHTNVAFLSQKIFLFLVYKFKANLKQEIEVFLSNIFLRVLESPNSSFKQKGLVLESLRSLCRDPVLLAQIFLNYDCDFDAMNLYKDIVHNLTKLSGKSTSVPYNATAKKEAEELYELSLAALEVLVTILKAFLHALGLPGGEEGSDESAGAKIRGLLSLDIAIPTTTNESKRAGASATESVDSADDISREISVREFRATARHNTHVMTTSTETNDSSSVAGKIVDAFEMKRNQEQNFEIGSVKFTLSLKSGLNFFIDNGFVECDAKEVALFFLARKDKLDKTQLGEALGMEPSSAFIKGDNIDPEKGGPGFWVRILHHYASAMDLTGLQFDDAIRLFLSGFRLPGEAQKIDRIMEKFAERFTRQNPDVFPSADTAFILAFSVIMLNTDLHNPSIKPERRMTLDSFIRNNRGIAENGGDLPTEFLTGIFERIKISPFSLKEDDAVRERVATQTTQLFDTSLFFEGSSFFGTSSDERKREKFKKEREEMMAATTQLIRRRPGKNSKAASDASSMLTDSVSPADVVKPMFDVIWGPVIGILSQVLECSDDERSITVCLNGFVYAVRLAAHSDMSLARDTFVTSLAKFTFLGSIKEMKQKNIESIRTLLSIAVIDGEYLGESWGPCLQCISQLARLRLSASGLDSDEMFLSENDNIQKRPSSAKNVEALVDAKKTEELNGRAVLEAVSEVLIDKVFSSTVKLSAQSLAHFIEQLIAVSTSDLAGNSKSGITGVSSPRVKVNGASIHGPADGDSGQSVFMLQKLVEVADFNMDVRPRLVWAQMWERMAEFFAAISSHENTNVSVFAIDSLKQLSFKFLDKPELSEFNFQRMFLRPFLHVMNQDGTREDIRELVLRCLDNIVRTKSHNLRSGWKIIFAILARSADDSSEKINFLGLAILQCLLDDHLDELCRLDNESEVVEDDVSDPQHLAPAFGGRNRNADVEDFVGLCRASLAFVHKKESDSPRPIGLSTRGLCHTAIYADLLADKRVHPPISGKQCTDPKAPGYTYAGLDEKEALDMVLWRSLLEGLAEGVRSKTRTSNAGGIGCVVQSGSILALRSILLRHGDVFSVCQWKAILQQTIIPSIQVAAEYDRSPVVSITSESPQLTSIDFLADSLPLPPPPDNEGLKKFETAAVNNSSKPKRPFGTAELLLEASFTDMRHGGDGDLTRAYIYAQKDVSKIRTRDQPFPDSWIATTAPIALGLLTDIASEIILWRGNEGRQQLWPLIANQYLAWCVGTPVNVRSADAQTWWPCEALVRIACREMHVLPERIADAFPKLPRNDQIAWTTSLLTMFSDALSKSVTYQKSIQGQLLRSKLKVYDIEDSPQPADQTLGDQDVASSATMQAPTGLDIETIVYTPYGKGTLQQQRKESHRNKQGGNFLHLTMNVIELDFGATLYRPAAGSAMVKDTAEIEFTSEALNNAASASWHDTSPKEAKVDDDKDMSFRSDASRENYWMEYVPALKVRCVAAYCLQHRFYGLYEILAPWVEKNVMSLVLDAFKYSRTVAEAAVRDSDLKQVFQDAIFSEWGDGVEEVEEALSNVQRLSHLHSSDMFFLTQEASATKSLIQMLGFLYQGSSVKEGWTVWDRQSFAEPHLLEFMRVALRKFQDSEERDGHLIDPNVWRNAAESGGKVALYCTSFADVVVGILRILLSMDNDHFVRHSTEFFPILCSLVMAQSREIRHLVQCILLEQVGPLMGLDPVPGIASRDSM